MRRENDSMPLCCCKVTGAMVTKPKQAVYCQALDSMNGKVLENFVISSIESGKVGHNYKCSCSPVFLRLTVYKFLDDSHCCYRSQAVVVQWEPCITSGRPPRFPSWWSVTCTGNVCSCISVVQAVVTSVLRSVTFLKERGDHCI